MGGLLTKQHHGLNINTVLGSVTMGQSLHLTGVPQPSLSGCDAGSHVAVSIRINCWLKKPGKLPHYTLLLEGASFLYFI